MQKNPSNLTPVREVRDPFQTLFQRFFGDAMPEFYGTPEAPPIPRVDVSETDHAYELAFELPGLEEKDINVNLQDHVLSVTAERRDVAPVVRVFGEIRSGREAELRAMVAGRIVELNPAFRDGAEVAVPVRR